MNYIAVAALTSEAFAPFGEAGAPLADMADRVGRPSLGDTSGFPLEIPVACAT